MKSRPKRRTRQQQQENKSRHQFCERLEDVGWVADDFKHDYGEDILVRVYDDGTSAGIQFPVQLKSTSRTTGASETDDVVFWDFAVKDLRHWEDNAPPVYLVVWDITKRTGWWISIPEAIRTLKVQNPSWRRQKTVRIHFPIAQDTSDSGLRALRRELASILLPVVRRGRRISIGGSIKIPHATEADREAAQKLRRLFEAGESCTLPTEYLKDLKFPRWIERLFGGAPWDGVDSVTISQKSSTERIPVRLRIQRPDGSNAEIGFLELSRIRGGTTEIVLGTVGDSVPLRVTFKAVRNASMTLSLSVQGVGRTVPEALNLLQFHSLMHLGGTLSIEFLKEGHKITQAVPEGAMSAPDAGLRELLVALMLIEHHTPHKFDLAQHWPPTESDLVAIHVLQSLIFTGSLSRTAEEVSMVMDRDGLKALLDAITKEPDAKPEIVVKIPTEPLSLLGQSIQLGPRQVKVAVAVEQVLNEWPSLLESADHAQVSVKLSNAPVVEEYLAWERRSAPVLDEQDGT